MQHWDPEHHPRMTPFNNYSLLKPSKNVIKATIHTYALYVSSECVIKNVLMWCVVQWQVSVAVHGIELQTPEVHAEIFTFQIAYLQHVGAQSGAFSHF